MPYRNAWACVKLLSFLSVAGFVLPGWGVRGLLHEFVIVVDSPDLFFTFLFVFSLILIPRRVLPLT